MNQNHVVQFPEEFRNIPASFLVFNPGAQALLGGFLIFDLLTKMKVRRKVTGAIAICSATAWAFIHPDRCHKATWKEHWGRQWMFD
jgi:hypothetical protein